MTSILFSDPIVIATFTVLWFGSVSVTMAGQSLYK